MLQFLMSRPGELITRDKLFRSLWGAECGEDFVYLRIYVSQLREKIEDDPLDPKYILTVPRIGYKSADRSREL